MQIESIYNRLNEFEVILDKRSSDCIQTLLITVWLTWLNAQSN